MTAEGSKKLTWGTMLTTGAIVIGWAMWRLIRGKPIFGGLDETLSPSAGEVHKKELSPLLPSLSKSVPGIAPLDKLARESEEENGTVDFASRVSAQISTRSVTTSAEVTSRNHLDEVLAAQSLASARIPGWNQPTPDRLPVPTFAPAIMAMGIVVFAMGIVTTWYVCVVGVMVFAVATWRWVGELQGE